MTMTTTDTPQPPQPIYRIHDALDAEPAAAVVSLILATPVSADVRRLWVTGALSEYQPPRQARTEMPTTNAGGPGA